MISYRTTRSFSEGERKWSHNSLPNHCRTPWILWQQGCDVLQASAFKEHQGQAWICKYDNICIFTKCFQIKGNECQLWNWGIDISLLATDGMKSIKIKNKHEKAMEETPLLPLFHHYLWISKYKNESRIAPCLLCLEYCTVLICLTRVPIITANPTEELGWDFKHCSQWCRVLCFYPQFHRGN